MDIPSEKRYLAINYLTYCIDVMECKDNKELYNMLIFFYSEDTENKDQLY
jgi:hypothetical protein